MHTVIPTLRRLRLGQEHVEFQASLGYPAQTYRKEVQHLRFDRKGLTKRSGRNRVAAVVCFALFSDRVV